MVRSFHLERSSRGQLQSCGSDGQLHGFIVAVQKFQMAVPLDGSGAAVGVVVDDGGRHLLAGGSGEVEFEVVPSDLLRLQAEGVLVGLLQLEGGVDEFQGAGCIRRQD